MAAVRFLGTVLLAVAVAGCAATSPLPQPTGAAPPAATPAPTAPAGAGTPSPTATTARPFPAPPPLTPALAARLGATLLRLRENDHLPGVQVAIGYANGWTWSARAGFADLATDRRVTPATLFDAGSITKTFVAALVLQLADQGVLRLDDRLSRWEPGFPGAAGITIRELLDHTSGIDDPFNHADLLHALGAHPRSVWTPSQVLAYVGRPHFAPGKGWYYSNANYLLLGQVIQAATGESVATLLHQHFLAPLGLLHTFLQGPQPPPGPAAHGYDASTSTSWAATDLSDGTRYLPFTSLATALGTAGGLATTADDLLRWAQALYGGHVLVPADLAQMVDVGLTRGLHPRWPYGLGLQQVTIGGAVTWGHSGLLSGFHAAMRYVPATGLTIAVLINTDTVDPDGLVAAFLGILQPGPPAPRATEPTPAASGAPAEPAR
jgi:D-alanyl-D-alanine carboxypeptidase